MPAYGTSRTIRTAVLPYDGVMRHPLTEGHTGLPEMDCPLITSEHSSRLSREESHNFNRGRSQTFVTTHFNDFIDNCEDCVAPSTVLKTLKEYLMDKPSQEVNGLFNSSLENITVAMAKTMGKLYY